MRLLLFSDLHTDLAAAASIVERAPGFDALVGAGDFAVKRRGLARIVEVLAAIEPPTVLVPGNGESAEELSDACDGWPAAHVLHGTGVEIGGVPFFGLGGGVPVTPFGSWSYDFTEDEARDLLAPCPASAVLVSHSPPLGHADADASGRHMGSTAVLETIERTHPRLVVCGHIHGSWGVRSRAGDTPVVNAGPQGIEWLLE
jgi:Icc-related predicted phosphoesterase